MTTIMYVSAILSRYRRCKPNQVLVVYGKTGGEKKSAKLYHGGAAFVLPIIQSYDILSMEPMQIDCRLTGALSSQNIRVEPRRPKGLRGDVLKHMNSFKYI